MVPLKEALISKFLLVKKKPLYRPKWPVGPVLNSGFLRMKWLGVLLLPPGWDASPSFANVLGGVTLRWTSIPYSALLLA